MKVLYASKGADYAGYGWHLSQAFPKHAPDIELRATRQVRNFFDYPVDLPWEQALDEWRKADVVHLLDNFSARVKLGAPKRPYVIRYAGTEFRRDPSAKILEQRRHRAIGTVATLDLYLSAPGELEWTPFIRDLDALWAMRRPLDDGILRIAHAPTRRVNKSTAHFLEACERLGTEIPVQVILIEKETWAESLLQRTVADVYFDQVLVGYGNNAVESWGMGIPVVAGGEGATLEEMTRRFGELPFYQATESTIYEALRALADPAIRQAYADQGRAHARRFHSEGAVVTQLRDIYQRALQ